MVVQLVITVMHQILVEGVDAVYVVLVGENCLGQLVLTLLLGSRNISVFASLCV